MGRKSFMLYRTLYFLFLLKTYPVPIKID